MTVDIESSPRARVTLHGWAGLTNSPGWSTAITACAWCPPSGRTGPCSRRWWTPACSPAPVRQHGADQPEARRCHQHRPDGV